ncbi:MAG: hypothetical protein RID53_17655 [Coleofasciculus sp. B1-GNL1-01]|uniref:hypothetical protein n=1 Tax=Coleofasciculus sp. B1-GNL1-01 TaxID=3068484 RepID=UPI0032F8EAAB
MNSFSATRSADFSADSIPGNAIAFLPFDHVAISRLVEINLTRLSYVNKPQTLTVPCSLFPVP